MNDKIQFQGNASSGFGRILSKCCLNISRSVWIPSSIRVRLLRVAGVKMGTRCFVGNGVEIDTIHPELVEIGDHVHLTSGVKILTHFWNPADNHHYLGKVIVEDDVFVGMNTLIVNPVTIGKGAVLAAGSVVNKDVPSGEIWGGNPAKFIKERV